MTKTERLILKSGAHPTMSEGGCVMEFAAYMAGEPHSDHPQCVSPIIGNFMRRWNDRLNDHDRQQLVPLALTVIGTRTTEADEQIRAWMIADWLVRTSTPTWLRLAKLETEALSLEHLMPITCKADMDLARPLIRLARDKARAAYAYAAAAAAAAAYAYAYAAAYAAADAAAAAAAAADADAYAYAAAAADAAAAAAADADADAAADADADADAALRPTVELMQRSAYRLVERLCAVGRKEEPEVVHTLDEAVIAFAGAV